MILDTCSHNKRQADGQCRLAPTVPEPAIRSWTTSSFTFHEVDIVTFFGHARTLGKTIQVVRYQPCESLEFGCALVALVVGLVILLILSYL